jgi:hypothetical protein
LLNRLKKSGCARQTCVTKILRLTPPDARIEPDAEAKCFRKQDWTDKIRRRTDLPAGQQGALRSNPYLLKGCMD